jgi:hypothetical protein
MGKREWDPITKIALAGFAIGVASFFVLLFSSPQGFILILDHANLLFHEAGHPIIGLLSKRLEPYGGTIGQLIFPCVLAVGFWRKRNPLAVAAAAIWFFENWLNIARYMADARAMLLPLVGGGDHDWNTILGRWNLLQYDTQIASVITVVAWIGIVSACAWVLWRTWLSRNNLAVARPGPKILGLTQ